MNFARLIEVAEIIRGVSYDGADAVFAPISGTTAILRAGNIANELLVDRDLVWVPRARVSNEQRLQLNDIVICMSSGSPGVVGKTARLEREFDGSVGAFCAVVRARPGIDPAYLSYWFRSPMFLAWRDAQARGASIQNLRVSSLADVVIPLPLLADQQQISVRLTGQFAVVARARAAATDRRNLVDQLIRAELVSALANRAGWQSVALHNVVEIQLGKMLSPVSRTGRRPIPYVRNANVQWDRVDLTDVAEMDFDEHEEAKFALRPGDVLVCEGGEPGRAAVWRGEITRCCFQKALHRLRPLNDAVDPEFLVFTLWLASLRGEFTDDHAKTTIAHLPAVRLSELRVSLPSLSTQRRLASRIRRRLDAIRHLQRELQTQIDEIRRLPHVILRNTFEGIAE